MATKRHWRTPRHLDAVAWLDTVFRLPGPGTRASIRLDPGFARLRGRADFERLLSSKP